MSSPAASQTVHSSIPELLGKCERWNPGGSAAALVAAREVALVALLPDAGERSTGAEAQP
jgi:hypothetical protein